MSVASKAFFIIAAVFIFLNFSLSPHYNVLEFYSSRVFVHLAFNAIIIAILASSCRPSSRKVSLKEDQGEDSSFMSADIYYVNTSSRGGDHDAECDGNVDDDCGSDGSDDDRCYSSNGYYEDNDDSLSDGDVGWEDEDEEEEYGNLEARIEAFMANVMKGWREENNPNTSGNF
ncbi:hypothetical protein Ancab_032537 [Ancistrocladus abbreviatus]